MKYVIRVDASQIMGTGHVVRCLALADALKSRGAICHFLCRGHPGNLIEHIRDRGHHAHRLPFIAFNGQAADISVRCNASADVTYVDWLGTTQLQDATETLTNLPAKPDWLIVDHYALNSEWEQRIRPDTQHMMAIDDLANRHHDCDVLLDQNYAMNPEARYSDGVPSDCKLMLGPKYALLQPEYASYRAGLSPHPGHIRRIFIFFGGTDPDNLTGLSLQALEKSDLRDVPVDVVVGPNNPNQEALLDKATKMPQLTLHSPRSHLADLMANADLAIGAGGTTTWERCCLGLPSIVISIADNQTPACKALYQDGIIHYAGPKETVSVKDLRSTITALAYSPETLKRLSVASMNIVDGKGCARVASHLCSIAQTPKERT